MNCNFRLRVIAIAILMVLSYLDVLDDTEKRTVNIPSNSCSLNFIRLCFKDNEIAMTDFICVHNNQYTEREWDCYLAGFMERMKRTRDREKYFC